MKLIFIYGRAAAGKLTVAKEVAKLTGYPLFHNHLIVNAVSAVFPFGSPTFVRLRHEFWMKVFEEASAQGQSLLFTFAPESTVPKSFVPEVIETISKNGGSVLFVHLKISLAEQERRIEAPDRRANGKLSSLETLRKIRQVEPARDDAIPVDLELDTEMLLPAESARMIVEKFRLEPAAAPYKAFDSFA